MHCVGNFASFDLHSQYAGGLGPGQVLELMSGTVMQNA